MAVRSVLIQAGRAFIQPHAHPPARTRERTRLSPLDSSSTSLSVASSLSSPAPGEVLPNGGRLPVPMPVPAPAPHLLPMRLFPLSGEHKVPANSVGFRRAAMANPAAEAADPRQVFIGTWPLAGDKHPLDLRLPDLVSLRTSDPSNPSAPYHLRPPLLVGGWGSFQRSFAWGRAESRRGAFAGCLRGCTRDQAGRPASPSALHCMSAPSPVGCQLPPGSYGPIYPGSAPPTPNLLSVTN